jgi:hypothetical protein
MKPCDCVTFFAHFPDDSQWDEEENLILPGGLSISTCLAEQLSHRGVPCSDVKQHSFYGWSFYADLGVHKTWILLQAGDDWLLLLEQSPRDEGFANLRMAIHNILRADTRFSKIFWHSREDYESGNPFESRTDPD